MDFKIFFQSASKAMADRKKKDGKMKIQKFGYLERKKELFR